MRVNPDAVRFDLFVTVAVNAHFDWFAASRHAPDRLRLAGSVRPGRLDPLGISFRNGQRRGDQTIQGRMESQRRGLPASPPGLSAPASKEACLASPNFGPDHGDPRDRLDGPRPSGPAVVADRRFAGGRRATRGLVDDARAGRVTCSATAGITSITRNTSALGFFREAETRKAELSKDEIKSLYQGIAKAQDGMRDPSNSNTRSYAKSGKRRPGALAYAGPSAPATLPATAPVLATQQPPTLTPPPEPDSIQLTSNSTTTPPAAAAIATTAMPVPAPVPSQAPMLAPQMPAVASAPVQAQGLALSSSPAPSTSA